MQVQTLAIFNLRGSYNLILTNPLKKKFVWKKDFIVV